MPWRCAAICAVIGLLCCSTPKGHRELIFTGAMRAAIVAAEPTMASIGGLTFTTAFGPATSVSAVRDADQVAPVVDAFSPEAIAAFDFGDNTDAGLTDTTPGLLPVGAQAQAGEWGYWVVPTNQVIFFVGDLSPNAASSLTPFELSSGSGFGDSGGSGSDSAGSRLSSLVSPISPDGPPSLTPPGSTFSPPPAAVPLPNALKQGLVLLLPTFAVIAVKRRRLSASLQPV